MEALPYFFGIGFWLTFCFVVAYVASSRGHSGARFLLISLVLSPILGLIIALCVKGRAKAGIASAEDVNAYLAYKAMKQQQAGSRGMSMPPAPPGKLPRVQVAKNGEVLGEFTVSEIRQAVRNGEVTLEDHFWDAEGQCWQELAALDGLS